MPAEEDSWKDNLPEELKESSELKNFESVEDLAKSYVHSSKLLSQRFEGVGEEDTFENFAAKAEKFFKLPKDSGEYKASEDENLNKLGFKYKLHPNIQWKPLIKEFQELEKKGVESRTTETLDKWKESNEKNYSNIKNKDEVLGRAFANLNTTREKFEEELKDFHQHPQVVKMLLKLGEGKGKAAPTTTSGEGGTHVELQGKIDFVKDTLKDHQGPYYNPKHPDYSKVRAKVRQYIPEIKKEELKTGIGVFKNQISN